VAEKIQAPLYKLELGSLDQDDGVEDGSDDESPGPGGAKPRRAERPIRNSDELAKAFELAAKWKAVLLIDECDMYLEARNEATPERNKIVLRFLRELEYYPSLLFLTTNRERALDPAIHSRLHLTINYPGLDPASRRAVWQTFLLGNRTADISDAELEILANVEVNGRRIRNIAKTAWVMAKREGRLIRFDDIKQVLRITEGLMI